MVFRNLSSAVVYIGHSGAALATSFKVEPGEELYFVRPMQLQAMSETDTIDATVLETEYGIEEIIFKDKPDAAI